MGPDIQTGALDVTISGLPGAAAAAVSVTGPGGFSRTLSASSTLSGLAAGTYTVTATNVTAGGNLFGPSPASQSVAVSVGSVHASAAVSYAIASGSLAVSIAGLPSGATTVLSITGPNGFTSSLSAASTLMGLAPGAYSIGAPPVLYAGFSYVVGGSPLIITVAASETPTPAAVTYELASGALSLTIHGAPAGSTPSVNVTGPAGFALSATRDTTVTNVVPGSYTATAASIASGADIYAAPSPIVANVTASLTPTALDVPYALATGRLAVTVTGLPNGANANVVVNGPNGYTNGVAATTTLTGLAPGSYVVTASAVNTGSATYAPTPATQSVQVTASPTAAQAPVTYALATGSLAITVTGLPGGAQASVAVSGPGGFQTSLTASATLANLTPGSYTISAAAVVSGISTYSASPATQSITVVASTTAATATVVYTLVGGSLQISITGLPLGTQAAVSVTGPGGFSAALTSSQTLGNLVPGSYTVAASNVTSGAATYIPSPASQNAAVPSAGTASVTVAYAAVPTGADLTIDGLYITQGSQTYTGTVPLVANRDGFLRVFVIASQGNTYQPTVRVRFYSGGVLTNTLIINDPMTWVNMAVSEGTLTSSWNAAIPGSWLQPGLSILADVDPTNAIAEPNENNNAFPANGTPLALNVQTVAPLNIRFVPVLQSANGLSGNVSAGNKDQYTSFMQKVYPLAVIASDVRATYTTSAPALQSDDANGAWNQILNEVDALRTADGFTGLYYGVVHPSYTSGVAGLGYVPGRSAIGWDRFPSASEVSAHEVGHNFGRLHAPCGNPASVDPSYPYAGGAIGVYGFDVSSNTLEPTTLPDLMGYCATPWISDYTYTAVMNFRAANPAIVSPSIGGSVQPVLLVWGRIHNGQLVLEPAYEMDARVSLPGRSGPNRIEGFDASGARLFGYSFAGQRVADSPSPTDETFAFAVPRSGVEGRLTTIRFSARGRQVELRAAAPPGTPVVRTTGGAPAALRQGAGVVRVNWTDPDIRGVLVRDGRSGQILSFGRGAGSTVRTGSADLEVIVSDGVRSERRHLAVK